MSSQKFISIFYVRQALLIWYVLQIYHHISWNPQVDYVCSKVTRLVIGCLQRNLCNCSNELKELKELKYKQFVLATSFRIHCHSLGPTPSRQY